MFLERKVSFNVNQIVFLDLDGTLLRDDLSISPYSISKLKEMKSQYDFIFCTGRSLSDSLRYYKELDLNTPIICHNGAYVHPGINMRYKIPLDKIFIESANLVTSFIYKEIGERLINMCISIEEKTYLYSGELDSDLLDIMVSKDLPTQIIGKRILELPKAQRIVISIENKSLADIDLIRKKFPKLHIGSWKNSPQIIDINIGNQKIDKWDALSNFIILNEIKKKQILYFGDSYNDKIALKEIDGSFAMKNSIKEIQQVASSVTQFCNNNDGVVNELKLENRYEKNIANK